MKYLCMVLVDEKKLEALSASESQALDDESLAYDDSLRKRGHLIAAQAPRISPNSDHCSSSKRQGLGDRWAFRGN